MFKFTIRELLLLTVIAALGLGWWLDRRQVNRWWSHEMDELGTQVYRLDHQLRIHKGDDDSYRVYRIVR